MCAIADANILSGGRHDFNFAVAYCDIVTQNVLGPLDTAYLNLNCSPSCRFIAFTVCNMHMRSSCAGSGALVCRNLPKKKKIKKNAQIRRLPELAETIGPKHLSYCLVLGKLSKMCQASKRDNRVIGDSSSAELSEGEVRPLISANGSEHGRKARAIKSSE